MAEHRLTDDWTELDLAGGVLQNRGATTVELSSDPTGAERSHALLRHGEIVSALVWGKDEIHARVSQTSSTKTGIVVIE
jgi:hypothetical protein